mmetsp:Transcript_23523/g.47205  ORF Transcript_23523/g.47205 Transcript_23523/m.47205 type:complete len:234 (-) Transcript_23523:1-702(-)
MTNPKLLLSHLLILSHRNGFQYKFLLRLPFSTFSQFHAIVPVDDIRIVGIYREYHTRLILRSIMYPAISHFLNHIPPAGFEHLNLICEGRFGLNFIDLKRFAVFHISVQNIVVSFVPVVGAGTDILTGLDFDNIPHVETCLDRCPASTDAACLFGLVRSMMGEVEIPVFLTPVTVAGVFVGGASVGAVKPVWEVLTKCGRRFVVVVIFLAVVFVFVAAALGEFNMEAATRTGI